MEPDLDAESRSVWQQFFIQKVSFTNLKAKTHADIMVDKVGIRPNGISKLLNRIMKRPTYLEEHGFAVDDAEEVITALKEEVGQSEAFPQTGVSPREPSGPSPKNGPISPTPSVRVDSVGDLRESRDVILQVSGFKVKGVLGEGGMGRAYHCDYLATDVAVKEVSSDGNFAKFLREIDVQSRIHHPRLVGVLGIVYARIYLLGELPGLLATQQQRLPQSAAQRYCMKEDPDHRLLVVQYCARGSLSDFLKQVHARRFQFQLNMRLDELCLRMLFEVAQGMTFLHSRGIVHLDLKLANVFLDDGWHVLVGDFGLATELQKVQEAQNYSTGRTQLTMTPHCAFAGGTLYYLPPEAFVPPQKLTTKADVFAFAMVCYSVCLTQGEDSNLYDARVVLGGENPLQYTQVYIKKLVQYQLRPDISVRSRCVDFDETVLATLIRLMCRCWETLPKSRPEFKSITEELYAIMKQASNTNNNQSNSQNNSNSGKTAMAGGHIASHWPISHGIQPNHQQLLNQSPAATLVTPKVPAISIQIGATPTSTELPATSITLQQESFPSIIFADTQAEEDEETQPDGTAALQRYTCDVCQMEGIQASHGVFCSSSGINSDSSTTFQLQHFLCRHCVVRQMLQERDALLALSAEHVSASASFAFHQQHHNQSTHDEHSFTMSRSNSHNESQWLRYGKQDLSLCCPVCLISPTATHANRSSNGSEYHTNRKGEQLSHKVRFIPLRQIAMLLHHCDSASTPIADTARSHRGHQNSVSAAVEAVSVTQAVAAYFSSLRALLFLCRICQDTVSLDALLHLQPPIAPSLPPLLQRNSNDPRSISMSSAGSSSIDGRGELEMVSPYDVLRTHIYPPALFPDFLNEMASFHTCGTRPDSNDASHDNNKSNDTEATKTVSHFYRIATQTFFPILQFHLSSEHQHMQNFTEGDHYQQQHRDADRLRTNKAALVWQALLSVATMSLCPERRAALQLRWLRDRPLISVPSHYEGSEMVSPETLALCSCVATPSHMSRQKSVSYCVECRGTVISEHCHHSYDQAESGEEKVEEHQQHLLQCSGGGVFPLRRLFTLTTLMSNSCAAAEPEGDEDKLDEEWEEVPQPQRCEECLAPLFRHHWLHQPHPSPIRNSKDDNSTDTEKGAHRTVERQCGTLNSTSGGNDAQLLLCTLQQLQQKQSQRSVKSVVSLCRHCDHVIDCDLSLQRYTSVRRYVKHIETHWLAVLQHLQQQWSFGNSDQWGREELYHIVSHLVANPTQSPANARDLRAVSLSVAAWILITGDILPAAHSTSHTAGEGLQAEAIAHFEAAEYLLDCFFPVAMKRWMLFLFESQCLHPDLSTSAQYRAMAHCIATLMPRPLPNRRGILRSVRCAYNRQLAHCDLVALDSQHHFDFRDANSNGTSTCTSEITITSVGAGVKDQKYSSVAQGKSYQDVLRQQDHLAAVSRVALMLREPFRSRYRLAAISSAAGVHGHSSAGEHHGRENSNVAAAASASAVSSLLKPPLLPSKVCEGVQRGLRFAALMLAPADRHSCYTALHQSSANQLMTESLFTCLFSTDSERVLAAQILLHCAPHWHTCNAGKRNCCSDGEELQDSAPVQPSLPTGGQDQQQTKQNKRPSGIVASRRCISRTLYRRMMPYPADSIDEQRFLRAATHWAMRNCESPLWRDALRHQAQRTWMQRFLFLYGDTTVTALLETFHSRYHQCPSSTSSTAAAAEVASSNHGGSSDCGTRDATQCVKAFDIQLTNQFNPPVLWSRLRLDATIPTLASYRIPNADEPSSAYNGIKGSSNANGNNNRGLTIFCAVPTDRSTLALRILQLPQHAPATQGHNTTASAGGTNSVGGVFACGVVCRNASALGTARAFGGFPGAGLAKHSSGLVVRRVASSRSAAPFPSTSSHHYSAGGGGGGGGIVSHDFTSVQLAADGQTLPPPTSSSAGVTTGSSAVATGAATEAMSLCPGDTLILEIHVSEHKCLVTWLRHSRILKTYSLPVPLPPSNANNASGSSSEGDQYLFAVTLPLDCAIELLPQHPRQLQLEEEDDKEDQRMEGAQHSYSDRQGRICVTPDTRLLCRNFFAELRALYIDILSTTSTDATGSVPQNPCVSTEASRSLLVSLEQSRVSAAVWETEFQGGSRQARFAFEQLQSWIEQSIGLLTLPGFLVSKGGDNSSNNRSGSGNEEQKRDNASEDSGSGAELRSELARYAALYCDQVLSSTTSSTSSSAASPTVVAASTVTVNDVAENEEEKAEVLRKNESLQDTSLDEITDEASRLSCRALASAIAWFAMQRVTLETQQKRVLAQTFELLHNRDTELACTSAARLLLDFYTYDLPLSHASQSSTSPVQQQKRALNNSSGKGGMGHLTVVDGVAQVSLQLQRRLSTDEQMALAYMQRHRDILQQWYDADAKRIGSARVVAAVTPQCRCVPRHRQAHFPTCPFLPSFV